MATLICGRDGITALQVFDKGMLVDPEGWSILALTGQPVMNMRLCPSCASIVRKVLDGAYVLRASP